MHFYLTRPTLYLIMASGDCQGIEGRLQMKKITHLSCTKFSSPQRLHKANISDKKYADYQICSHHVIMSSTEQNEVLNRVLFHTFNSVCPRHQGISSAADTT